MSKIALFDLDGTLADFDGAMRRDLQGCLPDGFLLPRMLGYDTDEPWLERLKKTIRRQPGWWRALPKFPLGWDVLTEARVIGFDVQVLTKGPASQPSAWAEKVEWCREHLPDVPVTITPNKGQVYGRVLVDDWPPYIEAWLNARPRGLVVMPAHPWNDEAFAERMRFRGRGIVRYDGRPGSLPEVRRLLQMAFDRETTR